MLKIMFNEHYGLETAVIEGRKPLTRRAVNIPRKFAEVKHLECRLTEEKIQRVAFFDAENIGRWQLLGFGNIPYQVGDVVAIAQSYKDAGVEPSTFVKMIDEGQNMFTPVPAIESAGWENKMYVRADLMPNQIRITDLRLERLQDISDEDCLKEGLLAGKQEPKMYGFKLPKGTFLSFMTPRDAFAALIDRISGRGTWESNPWVIAYTYELVKED